MRKKKAKRLKKLAKSIMGNKTADEVKKFYKRLKTIR